jgi:hypothetical protein
LTQVAGALIVSDVSWPPFITQWFRDLFLLQPLKGIPALPTELSCIEMRRDAFFTIARLGDTAVANRFPERQMRYGKRSFQ